MAASCEGSFTGPLAQWLNALIYTADGGKRLSFGMTWVPGVVLGAAWAAWRAGQFRWEGFTQTSDLARHLLGGAMMGFGGVCAMGCSFGQGLTGLSTLNWGSLLAVAAMVAGAAAWVIRRGNQSGWEMDVHPRLALV